MRRSIHFFALVSVALAAPACAQRSQPPEQARERMVKEQIEERGVKDPRVLEALRSVPRHLFVPPAFVDQAYRDTPLPTASGQTISQPYIVAFMTEQLRPRKEHVALEVGTGSGYQAAVLSLLVSKVYTIELLPELARSAAARLKKLGYDHVEVRQGDGYAGWPEHAPYDLIVVTAAPVQIPPALLDQLKNGGRMVLPIGPAGFQELQLVSKDERGRVKARSLLPVAFVPLVKP